MDWTRRVLGVASGSGVVAAMVIACTSFSSDPGMTVGLGPDATDAPPDATAAPPDAPLDTGAFKVGTATVTTSTDPTFSAPAAARPGDLLLAYWREFSGHQPVPDTTGWQTIDTSQHSPFFGGTVALWIGTRVFAGESAFTFKDTGSPAVEHNVVVVAFRNARAVQPVDPHVLVTSSSPDGGVVDVPVPSLQASSLSLFLFGFMPDDQNISWPIGTAGLDFVQTYAHLGIFAASSLSAGGATPVATPLLRSAYDVDTSVLAVIVGP